MLAARLLSLSLLVFLQPLCAQPTIKTFAGRAPLSGLATAVPLHFPGSIAVDKGGNLYIASLNNGTIDKVDVFGQLTIIAGLGYPEAHYAVIDSPVPALSVGLSSSMLIAASAVGDVYVCDIDSRQIRKISGGKIVTIAGTGAEPGFSGDGGPATAATFYHISALTADNSGNLLIADGYRIRKITGTTITTIAGIGESGFSGDNGPALTARIGSVFGISVGVSGEIFLADYSNRRVRKISGGIIATIAGNGGYSSNGDGGLAVDAALTPVNVAADSSGIIYVADIALGSIRKIAAGVISSAGGAELSGSRLAVDSEDHLYVGDNRGYVRRLAGGSISIVAGNGSSNFNGDGLPAIESLLSMPVGLATDKQGNVYIEDQGNNRIRKVAPSGIITSVIGQPGEPQPLLPTLPTVDSEDNLYVWDPLSSAVFKFRNGSYSIFAGSGNISGGAPPVNVPLSGVIALAAGSSGVLCIATGGDILKVSAGTYQTVVHQIGMINGMVVDSAGDLYIARSEDRSIRKLSGDKLTFVATEAQSSAVAVDPFGNLYATLYQENVVVQINENRLTRIAGSGAYGLEGDGGPALTASLGVLPPRLPLGSMAIDGSGNVFISEPGLNRVRQITVPLIAATVSTAPANLPFGVDGKRYLSTQTFHWVPGSQHTVTAVTGQLAGYPYIFSSWSDGGVSEHLVTVSASTGSYTASYGSGPNLSLSRTSLAFGISGNQVTAPQVVTVSAAAGVHWIATSDKSNIQPSPASGTGPGSFTVTAAAGPGGVITVSAPGDPGSPKQVIVTIATSSKAAVPFGIFDTPADKATVAGPIPVTGWALDSVEVAKVSIWRDPVKGETPTGNGLIFIGDAVFVDDARPDVAATFPTYPLNYRGGWGLQVLTNVLPNADGSVGSGNGIYKLHAIAENSLGAVLEIGAKTITSANATSAKPFGTIDTPAQGGIASGDSYVNFGWVLTPRPSRIASDGSTIDVYIDGELLIGHPVYDQYRSDIADAFPAYSNSYGAVGYFRFDTTAMENGRHSIGWTVTDDGGHVEGIGSRLFNVFNAVSPLPKASSIVLSSEPATYSTGFARGASLRTLHNNETIRIEQIGRLEIHLGPGVSVEKLPIGSKLDTLTGIFYWQPHASFLGKHQLRFTRHLADGTTELFSVQVQIGLETDGVREKLAR